MKPQHLVTPVILLVIGSQLHVGGAAESACQKYKDDPCADIICAYETWVKTSFNVNDKLKLSKDLIMHLVLYQF
ncbi:hypothetical protein O0I10_010921 [Lichtheimia ornata]|uniref:Uncharacterized protein n=1 Tax=Lichtheimia ornata TaxID=688661 RepID=A0AAD7XT17_9FUNG|nr:uncharacterized protein O0I10_010921 [Lichtheimia ornata]KAJ8653375.1 hypothetical protein O0I10_010921 [Lichtheimia ornata]